MKLEVWIFALLFLMPLVLGATIHGNVFDYSFRLAKNSVVKINTMPEQMMVAVDGNYAFNAPKGNYTLTALLKDETGTIIYLVEDNISIIAEGDYVRDLIMFPNEDLNALNLENNVTGDYEFGVKAQTHKTILIITGLIIIIIFVLLYCIAFKKCKFLKKEKTSTDAPEADDLADLVAFLRKNRRVTQKEIRKAFPLSEAKISLMLTDLESQGKIRKIKKGRGNIIVWDEK